MNFSDAFVRRAESNPRVLSRQRPRKLYVSYPLIGYTYFFRSEFTFYQRYRDLLGIFLYFYTVR